MYNKLSISYNTYKIEMHNGKEVPMSKEYLNNLNNIRKSKYINDMMMRVTGILTAEEEKYIRLYNEVINITDRNGDEIELNQKIEDSKAHNKIT